MRPALLRTNENSPICASAIPARRETRRGCPSVTATPVVTNPLSAIEPMRAPITRTGAASTARTSNSIPMLTKKSELNTSRSGRISPSAWWLYSDSLTMRPAMNAPSASDSPARDEAHAVPRQMRMTARRKTSRCLVATTW